MTKRLAVLDRRECESLPRPCPHTHCRYHLAAEVGGEVTEASSCALDIAEEGGITQAELAVLFGISHTWASSLERRALAAFRRASLAIRTPHERQNNQGTFR